MRSDNRVSACFGPVALLFLASVSTFAAETAKASL
jgi:hypothetical protein